MRDQKWFRKLPAILLVILLALQSGIIPASFAAQDDALVWTKTAETLFDGMTYDLGDVYRFVLSPLDRSVPYTRFAPLDAEIAAKGLTRADMIDLLADALEKADENLILRNMIGKEILALDNETLEEVRSNLFAGLKEYGIDTESAYASESAKTVVYWALRVYYTGALVTLRCDNDAVTIDNEAQTLRTPTLTGAPLTVRLTLNVNDQNSGAAQISFETQIVDGDSVQTESLAWTKTSATLICGHTYKLDDVFGFALLPYDTALPIGRLASLASRIEAQGLGREDMKALLEAAMRKVNVEFDPSSGQEILQLDEQSRRTAADAILAGLKDLGVEVTAANEEETAQTILFWVMRTYLPEKLVKVTCDPASAARIDSVNRIIEVPTTPSDIELLLTLTAADNENCRISFETTILGAFDPQVRSLKLRDAKSTLVIGKTYDLKDVYTFELYPFDASIPYATEMKGLDEKIAANGLDKDFMVSLIAAAMKEKPIEKDYSKMSGSDVMTLSAKNQKFAVDYVFVCLDRAGVEDVSAYMGKEPLTVLYWLLRTYDAGKLVTLRVDTPNVVDVDNDRQTIRVVSYATQTTVRLTLSANDPDPTCQPIVMDMAIEKPMEKLNPSNLRLAYKETKELTASKNVTWSSSDTEVVTVDKHGVVTAVGRGTAEITATALSTGETQTCSVTVRYKWWQWLIVIFLFGWAWY